MITAKQPKVNTFPLLNLKTVIFYMLRVEPHGENITRRRLEPSLPYNNKYTPPGRSSRRPQRMRDSLESPGRNAKEVQTPAAAAHFTTSNGR
jgi:hypothetical protein